MKELELGAIDQLIRLFRDFSDRGLVKDIIKRAKSLYNELSPGHTLLSNVVNSSVEELFPIGYPDVDPDREIPTRKEAKEIIEDLKKRKQELEK